MKSVKCCFTVPVATDSDFYTVSNAYVWSCDGQVKEYCMLGSPKYVL